MTSVHEECCDGQFFHFLHRHIYITKGKSHSRIVYLVFKCSEICIIMNECPPFFTVTTMHTVIHSIARTTVDLNHLTYPVFCTPALKCNPRTLREREGDREEHFSYRRVNICNWWTSIFYNVGMWSSYRWADPPRNTGIFVYLERYSTDGHQTVGSSPTL
jgi:hypothetical protein